MIKKFKLYKESLLNKLKGLDKDELINNFKSGKISLPVFIKSYKEGGFDEPSEDLIGDNFIKTDLSEVLILCVEYSKNNSYFTKKSKELTHKFLEDNDVNSHVLFDCISIACAEGNLELVKFFIDDIGVDFHSEYEYPLRCAIANNEIETVYYLLEKDADVTVKDNYPLRIAKENGRVEIYNLLLNYINKDKYYGSYNESLLDKLEGPTPEEMMNRKYELFLNGKINPFGYFLSCKENSYPYPEAEIAYNIFKDVKSMISVANEYYLWEYLIYLYDVKKIRLKEIANLNATVWRFELADNLNDKQTKYLEILKQVGCNKNNLDPMDQGYINRKLYKVPSYIFGCKYCGEPQPLKSLNKWSGSDVLCKCEKCNNYVVIGENNFWYYSK